MTINRREFLKLSGLLAAVDDVHGTAERTPQAFRFVGDPEDDLATLEKSPDMAVATESPSMV